MKKKSKTNYKRTTGSKNRWKLVWLPVIRNGIACMKDGTRYEVREDGWRRLRAS